MRDLLGRARRVQISGMGWRAILFMLVFGSCTAQLQADALEDGTYAFEQDDFAKALEILLPIAMKGDDLTGDPDAQLLIGHMYYFGEGVDQDLEESVKWYLAAANAGHAEAQYNIGYAYDFGEGVDQDLEEGAKWYLAAADAGHVEAQYNMGFAYEYGEGVNADVNAAMRWYELAAEQEHSNATYQLGWLYLDEVNNSKDNALGLIHLVNAAEAGHPDANYDLGVIHESGELITKDLSMALHYYREADSLGHESALQAIVPILDESAQILPYPQNIAGVGLSNSDYDAFYCENMTWAAAEGLKLSSADETDSSFDAAALSEFADDALSKIDEHRKNLLAKFATERYSESANYRELDALMKSYFDSFNGVLLLKRHRGESLTNEDEMALRRLEGGLVDVVYDDSFIAYFQSLDDEEFVATWDRCVSTYMPEGFFSKDISAERLLAIFDEAEAGRSLFSNAVVWGKRKITDIDLCEGDADFIGGTAVGVLATSFAAGDSALVVIGSSGALMAIIPAIAPVVTIAAAVGSTVYLGAKGYCYITGQTRQAPRS